MHGSGNSPFRSGKHKHALPVISLVVAALLSGAALADNAASPSSTGPTQAELDHADTDTGNWLTHNKGYLGYRFSPLKEITPTNARELRQVCTYRLGEKGSFQNNPIVYDGVLYTTTALTTVALDASTCAKRWEHRYKPGNKVVTPNNKGAALAAGRIIRGTPDGHLIALDAKTGGVLWDRRIMDSDNAEYATQAPLIWNDMVFIGKAGADRGIRGEMMAYSAADGHQIWSFHVIPGPEETGGDTWKNPASIVHGGGSLWTAISLDPQAGLLLLPIGNPGPDFDNSSRPGTNLFTNSLVALDARTGKLKWWHQLRAPDDRDWDTAVTAAWDAPDGTKLAMAAGKDGIAHVVDRTTGNMISGTPLVTRYEGTAGTVPKDSGVRVCPIAAVQWNGPAYNPDTHLMYMYGIDWCAQAIKGPTPVYKQGAEYLGWANYYGTRDNIDQAFGVINAIDPMTGGVAWRTKVPSIPLGGMLATATGLIITGETNGDVVLMDARTGRQVAKTNIGHAIGGGMLSYEAGGRQLIAVAAGDNNGTYGTAGENTIVVLGVPHRNAALETRRGGRRG